MPRASSLPERLRYLQPFRKKFVKRSEELHDSGIEPLFAIFWKRIKGLSQTEGEKILEDDIAALSDWLSAPAQQNDPLHSVIGVFHVYTPAKLVSHLFEQANKPPEPTLCLHMDLPTGAKLRRVKGGGEDGMLASWQGLLFALSAISEEAAANFDRECARSLAGEGLVISSVHFGEVSGNKYVKTGESWRGPCKHAVYILVVPGGFVFGSVSADTKVKDELNWDETKLEQYFHSLRVTV